MKNIPEYAETLFNLEGFERRELSGHEGGRNEICVYGKNGENRYIMRISPLGDRSEEDYLAETEFVSYLARNGAPVADVIPSVNGNLVESVEINGKKIFISLFEYAKGMQIADNGYRYREGAPLEEYFYNTGKAIGIIHRLSKLFKPEHRRPEYFFKYNMEYIGSLLPDSYDLLKAAIADRLDRFRTLPVDESCFGLVHFDFSDGNYNIDMSTGELTVFDFDNCIYCWYMYDLANLWTHGVGWCMREKDADKRMGFMRSYFDTVLRGYRSETRLDRSFEEQLPLFIDMVLIENIVDELECCALEGEEIDYDDIADAADCLINNIPYAGVGEK